MSIADDIKNMTARVTKQWTAQRKREERSSRARRHRREFMYSDRVYQKDVAWRVIPAAYAKVSSNGKYPAHARQIFYAARPDIQDDTGRPLESVYFTQNLLPLYVNEHPEAADWWIVYDARGRFAEPHTEKTVPLGTLEVHNYLGDIDDGDAEDEFDFAKAFDTDFPTSGTRNRISAVLFIEKEGFNELFKAVKLAERYDLAIMSSKGQSVVAARRLVDELCRDDGGVPLLVLHDFDKSGLEIAASLTRVSAAARNSNRVRYEFVNDINVIDLGIRLTDAEQWSLASEEVSFKGGFDRHSTATPAEKEFLRSNKRVELNAFTSEDFISFIEGKLAKHRIAKVIPDDDTLETAFRRAYQIEVINRRVSEISDEARAKAEAATLTPGLRAKIKKELKANREIPWDKALINIVRRNIERED